MIKINKQVSKSKINCFLQVNKIVLFFHCNNSISLSKNSKLLDLNKEVVTRHDNLSIAEQYSAQLSKSKALAPRNGAFERRESLTGMYGTLLNENSAPDTGAKRSNQVYKGHDFLDHNAFKSIVVKNRLARKVFLDRSRVEKVSDSPNQKLKMRKKGLSADSLFQGPTLLLGCSNIKMLKRGVEVCAANKGLILLGAFYDKSIINNCQIEDLIVNSTNNKGYLRLVRSITTPSLRPLFLIRYLLSLRCLLVQQGRLISLLAFRRQQISLLLGQYQ